MSKGAKRNPGASSAPVLREYARLAKTYDARWAHYVEATARETLKRLRPARRALDVGCGTGVLLERLARAFPETALSGVDPAPEMLEAARRRLPESVELRQAWAEALPFPEASFDAVISCNAFHFIRAPRAALREMRRALRPGGQLVITDWCADYATCRLLDAFLRRFNRAHFKTYRGSECVRLLDAAGQKAPRVDRYKIDWFWGIMTIVSEKPAEGVR